MNIVILDGYTCNPGDLSWAPFERFGKVTAYESTEPHQVVERCKNAEIVISNKTLLPRETLEQLEGVRYIGLLSTGYNVVDIKAADELGIPVSYVPAYSTNAVAQHTFALMLELCNHVGSHASAVREGDWENCRRFCFWNAPLTELSGKTFGIFGLGNIGLAVAKLAEAFGMQVIYHSRRAKSVSYELVSKEELFRRSDILSLHCPLNDQTYRLINEETLSLMKPTAFLINTTRGDVVDEAALADALNNHRLAGAALDVLCQEPPTDGSPLLRAENAVITPHLAWAAKETRARLIDWAADNLASFLAGEPKNLVR
ncbi:MAG: D-2-hydroxyacid dehydrogenase [Clostridia bacterium]|nr:D-2-hydroxyacid dehydrogenase [Clostridia bacterium]